jgi:hypothetical protein
MTTYPFLGALALASVLAACAPPSSDTGSSDDSIVEGVACARERLASTFALTAWGMSCSATLVDFGQAALDHVYPGLELERRFALTAQHCVSAPMQSAGCTSQGEQPIDPQTNAPVVDLFPPNLDRAWMERLAELGATEEAAQALDAACATSASLPECVRATWEDPGVCGYERELWLRHQAPIAAVRNLKTFAGPEAALCNSDIALILLEAPIPEPFVPAKVRRQPVAAGEHGLIAAGYGLDEALEDPQACLETAPLSVAAAAGAAIEVDTSELPGEVEGYACLNQTFGSDDPTIQYVGTRELALGAATCNGDSGGPLFDAQGQLAGVASRGTIQCSGPGAWSVFTDVGHHGPFFDDALTWLEETLASEGGVDRLAPRAE